MIKVYRYGALARSIGPDIRQQLRLGHKYYNKLVEAENQRREAFWGGPKPPTPPAGADDKQKAAFWKALRTAYRQQPPLDVTPIRQSFAKQGLYWGTYNKIERAFSAAWTKTDSFKKVKFRSWREGGAIEVQIQKSSLGRNLVQIEKAPDPRTGRRAGQRHLVRVRLGTQNGKPIWSLPIQIEMHRPLPVPHATLINPDGDWNGPKVTHVFVHLRYQGVACDREVWSVQFICRNVPEAAEKASRGVVAIDVGWRKLSDGRIRLAMARGDDGRLFELSLPDRWSKLSELADRIRSHRDNNLNNLKKTDPRFSILKSPASVARYSRNMGISSPTLDTWIKREQHLRHYEEGCRRGSYGRRRNDVRVWLDSLRREYRTAVIKDSAHKQMKEQAAEKKTLPRAARRRGHHAAPGEVIEEITRYFGRDTGVEIVEAPFTTAYCPACSHVNQVGPEQMITCDQCGVVADRDHMSTKNMLALYANGESKKPTVRKTTARFAKRHKKKSPNPSNTSNTSPPV